MTDAVNVLFVTADEARANHAARELESISKQPLRVAPGTTVEAVREAIDHEPVHCVIYAEDEPLNPGRPELLDVVDACLDSAETGDDDAIPIVLFSEEYDMSTAKATGGIADFVRADVEEPFPQLASRIRWTTEGVDAAWYETLVESMNDGVLVVDSDDRIEYANRALGEVLEVVAARWAGNEVGELADAAPIPGEDADDLRSAVESVVAEDGPDTAGVDVCVEVDGDGPRTVAVQVVTLAGGESGALATLRDVSEYKRAERLLEETRRRIDRTVAGVEGVRGADDESALFAAAADALEWMLNSDAAGVERLDEESIASAASGPAADPTPGSDPVQRARGEGPLVVDDPDEAPVEDAGSLLAVPVDDAVLWATSSDPGAFDEHDRRLVEVLAAGTGEALELVRCGRDLATARARVSGLLEGIDVPVVAYSVDQGGELRVVDANGAFRETFGTEDPVGDPLRDHVRIPDEEAPGSAPLRNLDVSLRDDQQLSVSGPRATPDGPRTFSIRSSPADAGEEDGYLTYVDVTDRRRYDRAVDRQSTRLDRITDLATDTLRDRLNEARGYLELAVETGDTQDMAEVRRAHGEIGRSIENLREIARQSPELETEVVDVERVATRAWADIETGGASVLLEAVAVEADPNRLKGMLKQLFRDMTDPTDVGDPLEVEADPSLATVENGTVESAVADQTTRVIEVGPLSDSPGFYVSDSESEVPASLVGRILGAGGEDTLEEAKPQWAAVQQIADAHGWTMTVEESAAGGVRLEFRVEK